MNKFQQLREDELARAKSKFPEPTRIPKGWTPHQLLHYWYGVIAEEFNELQLEVFSQEFDPQKTLDELVQLAAMCQRAAESLGLLESGKNLGVEYACGTSDGQGGVGMWAGPFHTVDRALSRQGSSNMDQIWKVTGQEGGDELLYIWDVGADNYHGGWMRVEG